MYLTEPAIDATLATVRAFARSSEIVLTFASPPTEAERPVSRLAQMAAAVGEPWITYYEPAEIERKLLHAGFSQVLLLSPAVGRGLATSCAARTCPRRPATSIVSALV